MITRAPAPPQPGQVVRVRSRQYLVEAVVAAPNVGDQTLVRLSCLEDDAQGVPLDALWEKEVDAQILDEGIWAKVGEKGFDPPRLFSAYLNTLRWNSVTATDPKLFQAPWRAGIDVKAYQLEPLRKALLLPRVNLFIADDVGLGKTVEAGLIVRELLLRQKVRRIVICCPPSVVPQWHDEMEQRFGLTFQVFDRDFVLDKRRERGYGVNPWNTHTRFILSHALLRDPVYSEPLRDWLGDFAPGSLLILDEAHNAAPASGAKYAIDSNFTHAVREVAQLFEHRLFLTATPHNGHSNSFSALLEILDPQRFCRGVQVKGAKLLQDVMVRRLKSDLRDVVAKGFPVRQIVQVDIDGLPDDAPDLRLPRLLGEYADLRQARFDKDKKSVQNAAALVTISLQKRLLSSIEAFWRTLEVHRRAVEKAPHPVAAPTARNLSLLKEAPGADDDRAGLPEEQVQSEEDAQMQAASEASAAAMAARERDLLAEMGEIANAARGTADPRIQKLTDWIHANLCPGGRWNLRRVLIFTEYTDTKRYLEQQLRSAIASTDHAEERIATFHGGMGDDNREEVKRAFNTDPAKHPLRILIATDAAREGVNLQNHCADLFHFDVPWNPGRMEQRNGRIDRVLQRAEEVRCHYFFFKQRPEDRVLRALVKKTDTIEKELGSLSPVLDRRLQKLLGEGIRRSDADSLARSIEAENAQEADRAIVEAELEEARERREDLARQIDKLRDMLKVSKDALGLQEDAFREALSCALEMVGAEPLAAQDSARWSFPALDKRHGADPTWAETMDTLRAPRARDQKPWDWRRDAPPRPIVFKDPGTLDNDVVHLHLEHRVVQRLLGRFRSQGFVHDDLSRACVGQTQDPIPRVVILGRLSIYGEGAARLHDEVVAMAARWVEPDLRKDGLKPFGSEAEERSVALLYQSLVDSQAAAVPDAVQKKLLASVKLDMAALLPHLKQRAESLADKARERLRARGEKEAKEMGAILEAQRARIEETAGRFSKPQLMLQFDDDERRQIDADRRHWQKRLDSIGAELKTEPDRIQRVYDVKAVRVEPAGLVYLWPVTG
jgi:ERCC4-related helicase